MSNARNLAQVAAVPQTFRNKIINGNFDVWQRGTSTTFSATNNAFGYMADRWIGQVFGGSSGTGNAQVQVTQQAFALGQTAVPGEPRFFQRVQALVLPTLGGTGGMIRTRQSIEGVRTLAGQTVTVSFYAKADSARTMALMLIQSMGSGGAPSPISGQGQTFAVTTAWQKFTITLPLPSLSGKTLGTAGDDVVEVAFYLYKNDNTLANDTLGQVGTYTTAAYLDLSQVQVEAGVLATPFEFRQLSAELALCQRYYERAFYRVDTAISSAAFFGSAVVSYKVAKRASVAPTRINEGVSNCTFNSFQYSAETAIPIYNTTASGGNAYATLVVDAEL